jgi:hypothetical protein
MGFVRGSFAQLAQDEALQITPALVASLVRVFLEGAGTPR